MRSSMDAYSAISSRTDGMLDAGVIVGTSSAVAPMVPASPARLEAIPLAVVSDTMSTQGADALRAHTHPRPSDTRGVEALVVGQGEDRAGRGEGSQSAS